MDGVRRAGPRAFEHRGRTVCVSLLEQDASQDRVRRRHSSGESALLEGLDGLP